MNEQLPDLMQQMSGQVRSMFYLLDEPTTMLMIQADGQMVTARASGQGALLLRALPRGAQISVTLHHAREGFQIIAFAIRSS